MAQNGRTGRGPGRPASEEPAGPDHHGASWRGLLRAERLRLGLTQAELAGRAGIAAESLRKYENGDRSPSRSSLERLLAALEVPHATARAVLREVGFAAPGSLFTPETDPDYAFTAPQLRAFVDETPWPQFVVNDVLELVAANRAAGGLWGIDLEAELGRRSRAQLNFLSIAAERHFRSRLANWPDLMARLVAILKAIPQGKSLLDDPGSLFGDVFAAFASNDPSAIPALFGLWERTPPASAKVRWNYPVVWREPGFDEIRFLATVTTASDVDALGFNDWIPADAASHAAFEAILAARGNPPATLARRQPRR